MAVPSCGFIDLGLQAPAMTQLRVADLRFLADSPPKWVTALGLGEPVKEALIELGLWCEPESGDADLVLVRPRFLRRAISLSPRQIIVVGGGAGFAVARLRSWNRVLALGLFRSGNPRMVATNDHDVRCHLLDRMRPDSLLIRRFLAVADGSVLATVTSNVASITRGSGIPYPIEALTWDGAGTDRWYIDFGVGDDLQRVIAQVFADPESPDPTWVGKFSRTSNTFDRAEMERPLIQHLSAVPSLAPNVVTVLSTAAIDGYLATAESYAPGRALSEALRDESPWAWEMVGEVERWITELARRTGTADESVRAAFMERMAQFAMPDELLDVLGTVPLCLAHNDLGTWNIIANRDGFKVTDWESGSFGSPVLWDLAYFLTDAMARRFGPGGEPEQVSWALDLWAGQVAESHDLFDSLDGMRLALGVSPEACVGALIGHWVFHSGASAERRKVSGSDSVKVGVMELVARGFLADCRLGLSWRGWNA